jgi:hypothetical protein
METENTELVINEKQVNRFALLSIVGIIVVFYLPFASFWGYNFAFAGLKYMIKVLIFWLIPIILVHEGLHGLFWALAIKGNIKQIKFGFNKQMMAPYTHCKIPLSKKAYLIGGMAPLILLGICPSIIFFILGNAYYYTLSLVCIWTSSGDILSCYHLIKVPNTLKIQDHPDSLGFILVREGELTHLK